MHARSTLDWSQSKIFLVRAYNDSVMKHNTLWSVDRV